MAATQSYHAQQAEEVLRELHVDQQQGLADDEVQTRREQHGLNELEHAQRRSAWRILLEQFESVVIIILSLAGLAALITAQWTEAIAIAAVVVVNTLIGFFTEYKAVRSMEALREMGGRDARVRRGGEEVEVRVPDLVPGDIVLVKKGDLVPADLRLLVANKLRVNEAALTGESVPAGKTVDPVDENAQLADRDCLLFKGTSVADGDAESVVVATGGKTELGRISALAEEASSNTAPLQQRLDQLGRYLAYITIGVAILVAISGLLVGRDTTLMIETSIALGVAAIPEGLPIVATIALARGMWLMAQRNALVNRLTAVETLGATRIIFTDKTGTLTENRMTLRKAAVSAGEKDFQQGEQEPEQSEQESEAGEKATFENGGGDDKRFNAPIHRLLEIAVLCNGANLANDEEQASGDPTEMALLQAGRQQQLSRDQLLSRWPVRRTVEFDPEVMMMATFHQRDDKIYVAVKGAPHAVFDACEQVLDEHGELRPFDEDLRQSWDEKVDRLAGDGLRMLAMADRQVDDADGEPYEGLTLVGLAGLLDPPRGDVRESIRRCQTAGIRVLMVTGDQPITGQAIGRAVGIGEDHEAPVMQGRDLQSPDEMSEEHKREVLKTVVFARVNPEQKLDLVEFYQQRGEPVAMTGDGVNDAPALKKADIGIAMGQRGTDAARQAADMILRDDSFQSIVAAIEQGRIIFANIRKSVVFMLCTNVAEILAVTIATLIGAPLPLRPLQILFLNVGTDVFPALALGIGKGHADVMTSPPRDPDEAVLTRHHWLAIVGWSVVIAIIVLIALLTALLWLDFDESTSITVSFLTLGFAKLWFVFNLRDHDAKRFNNDIIRNRWLWAAIGLCVCLLLAAVYLPGLSDVLQTRQLNATGWGLVLLLSLAPALLGLVVPGIRFYSAGKRHRSHDED